MAIMFPSIASVSSAMTSGERRFGLRLEKLLDNNCLCWFDIPVGRARRYPDFIVLDPSRGLLFLEIKDWKLSTLKKIDHQTVCLEIHSGQVNCANPILQARQYTYQVINELKRDKSLQQIDGKYAGSLVCPYGYGVVLTNITRKQLQAVLGEEGASVLPEHLVICQDEMTEKVDPEEFQQRLWDMFGHQFNSTLTDAHINRIRAHLFPEIRIDTRDLFSDHENEAAIDAPDIVKVMDMQQEQLARSFGEGHRVVHGVAGSGKTLILVYRCWYLAKTQSKPILVLCYNISLAAKLRSYMREKGVADQVQVHHFHEWCAQQLRTHDVALLDGDALHWERQVASVIKGVDDGLIPQHQYGAVLVDEGHDFESHWLSLIVKMTDQVTNSFLLLYDDAQSIYKKDAKLKFTLSSVGIQARGRTSILKVNYRNTREILNFAMDFANDFLQELETDEDSVPLVKPQIGGKSGEQPVFRAFSGRLDEINFICRCLVKWHAGGTPWREMAVIYCYSKFAESLARAMENCSIPYYSMKERAAKRSYMPENDQVLLVTRQSSKGLEFDRVIVAELGSLREDEDSNEEEIRLLYVAMTRARETLLFTSSAQNIYTEKINTREKLVLA